MSGNKFVLFGILLVLVSLVIVIGGNDFGSSYYYLKTFYVDSLLIGVGIVIGFCGLFVSDDKNK